MLLSSEFVRQVTGPPNRVILVGNGATANGWLPIRQALAHLQPRVYPQWSRLSPTTQDAFLPYITTLQVFEYQAAVKRITHYPSRRNVPPSVSVYRNIKRVTDTFFEFLEHLGQAYTQARSLNAISFQPEIDYIQRYFSSNAGIITLNWDELAWFLSNPNGTPAFANIIQLHGRATYPESMVLPTELILTEGPVNLTNLIRSDKLRANATKAIQTRISHSFLLQRIARRTSDIDAALRHAHFTAMDWLENASELVLWGIALNQYDSELLTILNLSAEERLNRNKPAYSVAIVDVDPNVKSRAAGLFRVPEDSIKFTKAPVDY